MVIQSKKINKTHILKTKKNKTKNMYNMLKTQIGGASNFKLMFSRDEYKNNFNKMFENLVLYNHTNNKTFKQKTNNINKHLTDKLDNLMTLTNNDNEVDLTFINEIYSFPYLDVAGFFGINKTIKSGKPHYEFINNDKNYQIYNISRTISVGTGAGDILLLTKKEKIPNTDDYPNELVLKIYNKKPIVVEHKQKSYNSIGSGLPEFITNQNISEYGYRDYTAYSSLNIFNISNSGKYTYQGNYNEISFDTFIKNNKAFELDSHNCLIEKFNTNLLAMKGGAPSNTEEDVSEKFYSAENNSISSSINTSGPDFIKNTPRTSIELKGIKNKEYLYLASSYDDFINEFIQQIIMKHIISKYDKLKKKMYLNNIMNFYNSMVIPIKEGSNVNYYGCLVMEKVDGNLRDFLQLETLTNKSKLTNIIKSITEIDNILKILKNPNNCFCHTDLKLENVFYKDMGDGKYKFILADYDKSSISYNKIRFFNSGWDYKIRSYNLSLGEYNYNINKDNKTYTIGRPKTGKEPIFEGFELEQLLLRYNPFPTIMKLDLNVFLVSLFFNDLPIFAFLTDTAINNNTSQNNINKTKLLDKCYNLSNITRDYASQIRTQYTTSIKKNYNDYNGNFGKLIFYTHILNSMHFYYNYKLANFYNTNCINMSLLTDNENKLIISNGLSNVIEFAGDGSSTGRSKTYKDTKKNIVILFTGNSHYIKGNIYFKTNRYTSKGANIAYKAASSLFASVASTVGISASSSLLYEWDYCKVLANEKLYSTFWDFVKASASS